MDQNVGFKRQRERERIDIGENIIRLSNLEDVLSKIIDIMTSSIDAISQAYLIDCTIYTFSDEYHLQTLQELLKFCTTQVEPKVDIKNINNDMSTQNSKIDTYSMFKQNIDIILDSNSQIEFKNLLDIQVAFLNFTSICYRSNSNYVNEILKTCCRLCERQYYFIIIYSLIPIRRNQQIKIYLSCINFCIIQIIIINILIKLNNNMQFTLILLNLDQTQYKELFEQIRGLIDVSQEFDEFSYDIGTQISQYSKMKLDILKEKCLAENVTQQAAKLIKEYQQAIGVMNAANMFYNDNINNVQNGLKKQLKQQMKVQVTIQSLQIFFILSLKKYFCFFEKDEEQIIYHLFSLKNQKTMKQKFQQLSK